MFTSRYSFTAPSDMTVRVSYASAHQPLTALMAISTYLGLK